jgi:hypothetical protein
VGKVLDKLWDYIKGSGSDIAQNAGAAVSTEAVCLAWQLCTGGKPRAYQQADGTYLLQWEGEELVKAQATMTHILTAKRQAGKYKPLLLPLLMPAVVRKLAVPVATGVIVYKLSQK